MGSFICSISERDWEIARTKGIYGNKTGKVDHGVYHEFDLKTKHSIIRDLIGMKKGDKVFFHVLTKPSRVHGIYTVRESPFHDDTTRIWDDPNEIFPYRFLFEPHPKYAYLCNHDAKIDVVDFYELIEQRKIWSLATLENETNIEARSVRKIEDGSETKVILRLLHRDYRYRRDRTNIRFSSIRLLSHFTPIRDCIRDIVQKDGKKAYENSIKALLMYKLGQNDLSITSILGPVSDFMNEVFIAQTTRKSIDILCIQSHSSNSRRYIICEIKTDKCKSDDLSQLLEYMDLFKRRDLVNIYSDVIDGCLIGRDSDDQVKDFSGRKNVQGINGNIILVEYRPSLDGRDVHFRRIN